MEAGKVGQGKGPCPPQSSGCNAYGKGLLALSFTQSSSVQSLFTIRGHQIIRHNLSLFPDYQLPATSRNRLLSGSQRNVPRHQPKTLTLPYIYSEIRGNKLQVSLPVVKEMTCLSVNVSAVSDLRVQEVTVSWERVRC